MNEAKLQAEDEALRVACEREALRHWPGARVLVDTVEGRYRAAVYLPEDGADPGASAERSEPRTAASEALRELCDIITRQDAPLLERSRQS